MSDPSHDPSSGPQPSPRQFGCYLAGVLLVPLLGILVTIPLAGSRGFLRISRRPLWHATEYRFIAPPQRNCDVVIAGDSSGMIGVDPRALEAATGWTTCNLALPYIGTALAGTRVLDDYLARNRPPHFIVFHLNDDHLHRPVLDEDNGIVDGLLMADEHFPVAERMRLFLSHPLQSLRFVASVWKGFLVTQPILRPDWTGKSYERDIREQQSERGWMPEAGTTESIVCGWQPPEVWTDAAYLKALTARYTRGGTRVVIWANPARDCDKFLSVYRRNAQALGLPPIVVYDRSLFFDAFHLNTEGAARNATELAAYLKSRVTAMDTKKPPQGHSD